MKRRTDITGCRYNQLTVVGYSHTVRMSGVNRPVWDCLCDCGTTIKVLGHCLKSGNTKSCGCRYNKNVQRGDEVLSILRRNPCGRTRSELAVDMTVNYQHLGRLLRRMVREERIDKVPMYGRGQDRATRPLAYVYVLPEWDTGNRTGGYYTRTRNWRVPKPSPAALYDRIMETGRRGLAPIPERVESKDGCAENGWAKVDGRWEYAGS